MTNRLLNKKYANVNLSRQLPVLVSSKGAQHYALPKPRACHVSYEQKQHAALVCVWVICKCV